MHANVSKTALISLNAIILTQYYYYNIQLESLQHHTKHHPNQLKSMWKTGANRLSTDLVTPSQVKVAISGIKW